MPVERSDTIEQLALALSKAQGEFSPVPMNSTNPFLHNKYADLGSVITTSKPILAKYELAFTQVVTNTETLVTVDTVLMHSSGQWISSRMSLPVGEEKGKSLAQVVGGLITYMRRYALAAIIGVHTEEDVDGNTRKQKESIERQEEPEKVLANKIIAQLKNLGGFKNDALVALVKEFEPSANPLKIKDMKKLQELEQKIKEYK